MSKTKSESNSHDHHSRDAEPIEHDPQPKSEATEGEGDGYGLATAATVGVVAVGALVFEAALLPGLILGAAAALAPRYLPQIGSALSPLYRSTVRGAYKLGQKSREALAEAQEHFHDIAAEVDAEEGVKTKAKEAAGDTRTPAAA